MKPKQAFAHVAGAILLLGMSAGTAFAQTGSRHSLPAPGIVVGKVYDRETGEPLVGGMVVLENTSLGNIATDDGSYFIGDVPAGTYRIRADYLGYQTVTHSVRVASGDRAAVDFAMEGEAVQTAAVVAVVEKEPIPIQPPVKSYTISSEVQGHVPDEVAEETCSVATTVHGSYIINGTWELSASVGRLLCGDQVIECQPVVVRKPQLAAVADDGSEATAPTP